MTDETPDTMDNPLPPGMTIRQMKADDWRVRGATEVAELIHQTARQNNGTFSDVATMAGLALGFATKAAGLNPDDLNDFLCNVALNAAVSYATVEVTEEDGKSVITSTLDLTFTSPAGTA
jgi:hypothetical protein